MIGLAYAILEGSQTGVDGECRTTQLYQIPKKVLGSFAIKYITSN